MFICSALGGFFVCQEFKIDMFWALGKAVEGMAGAGFDEWVYQYGICDENEGWGRRYERCIGDMR